MASSLLFRWVVNASKYINSVPWQKLLIFSPDSLLKVSILVSLFVARCGLRNNEQTCCEFRHVIRTLSIVALCCFPLYTSIRPVDLKLRTVEDVLAGFCLSLLFLQTWKLYEDYYIELTWIDAVLSKSQPAVHGLITVNGPLIFIAGGTLAAEKKLVEKTADSFPVEPRNVPTPDNLRNTGLDEKVTKQRISRSGNIILEPEGKRLGVKENVPVSRPMDKSGIISELSKKPVSDEKSSKSGMFESENNTLQLPRTDTDDNLDKGIKKMLEKMKEKREKETTNHTCETDLMDFEKEEVSLPVKTKTEANTQMLKGIVTAKNFVPNLEPLPNRSPQITSLDRNRRSRLDDLDIPDGDNEIWVSPVSLEKPKGQWQQRRDMLYSHTDQTKSDVPKNKLLQKLTCCIWKC